MGKRDFNHVATEESKDEWLTPPGIISALGAFDLDPCAPHRNRRPWATAANHFSGQDFTDHPEDKDGLLSPWEGRVWLNPPYGNQTFDWMKRLADHKRGVALIFARTETKGFHREIWQKADSVFFFEGRLCFHHVTGEKGGTSNAPSCLVSYSREDSDAILFAKESGSIKGRFVKL